MAKNIIYAIIVLLEVALFSLSTVDAMACELDDEFNGSSTANYTDEFNNLVDLLEEKTFNSNRSTACLDFPNQLVFLDYNSNFLWSLRYDLYDQGLNNNEDRDENSVPLVVKCNAEQEGECDLEKFRICMKNLRVAMLEDIKNFWDTRVDEELTRLAQKC